MKENKFAYQLFVEELENMLSCEIQIIEALPHFIKLASSKQLKEALTEHLSETKNQVNRIISIFSILGFAGKEKTCEGMKGILNEGSKAVRDKAKSPMLDATIICAAQKVEHYEIASYGTLRSFAKRLDLSKDIINLLKENIEEEGAADKKLTKIAEGSLFSEGVNKEAVEECCRTK